ncbi:MAG: phospholipase [Roseobacter sp.]|jgi:predicted esterase|nr:phospholipase [Roseobacter sp.]
MLTSGRSAASASFGLVLLHGRGAGARDIMGFGEALALPDLAFVAPEADRLSWWPTSFLAPTLQMEPFVRAGMAQVDTAVAALTEAGLSRDRIGVLGFSQGGCLAAEYLARNGSGLGYGVILSGGLVGTADANTGSNAALYGFGDKLLSYETLLPRTQVYMSCHANDPHIPHKRFMDTVAALRDMGAKVEDRTKPGQGHGIDEADVAAVRKTFNVA